MFSVHKNFCKPINNFPTTNTILIIKSNNQSSQNNQNNLNILNNINTNNINNISISNTPAVNNFNCNFNGSLLQTTRSIPPTSKFKKKKKNQICF